MGEEHRIVIPGMQERVPDVCDFVVAAARRAGLNERAVYHCQMAVDEACTNIIEHGFLAKGHTGQIEIVCRDDDDSYRISIIDDSAPFDPLDHAEPDPNTPLSEREPGGWGIYFIKKMMDEAHYAFVDGSNRLTIAKQKTEQNLALPASPRGSDDVMVQALSDTVCRVVPTERLESNTAPALQALLDDKLSEGFSQLIIDMDAVSYISTSGLKVLVNVWRQAKGREGNVILAAMNPHVFEVFETVGFDQIFEICDSVDDALVIVSKKTV
jgi:serine/threonine-protein kinase RsbW